jgi:hypothetical protein
MTRPRSADDFVTIRARMKELRRERTELPVEKDSPPIVEAPLYVDNGSAAPSVRPGIPGWRVARRRRPS